MNTAAQALSANNAARATIDLANTRAHDLAAFNATIAPLTVSSQALKADINIGDEVRVINAPKSRANKIATVVAWEWSCFGYSIAHVRYEGVKRTYPVSIFALYI